MTIEQLKMLLSSGHFHHATYRTDFARGLHIYRHALDGDIGFNGHDYVGMFSEYDKELCDEAYRLVRKSGIYEGSYK